MAEANLLRIKFATSRSISASLDKIKDIIEKRRINGHGTIIGGIRDFKPSESFDMPFGGVAIPKSLSVVDFEIESNDFDKILKEISHEINEMGHRYIIYKQEDEQIYGNYIYKVVSGILGVDF